MVAGLQTAWAQGFRVYESDGMVSQFSLRTDSIVFYEDIGGDVDVNYDPFTPVNRCIVGTWWKSKYESVTFNEDGTTDYMGGATYKFFPYQGNIVIYNASDAPVNYFKVLELRRERMIVSSPDGSNISIWSRTMPVYLVKTIELSETSITLQPDETKTLTATVLPEDADNKEVIWESNNEEVAEVNKNGRIIANGIGTCVITCRATDGSGVKAECAVTVSDIQVVTGITLSQTSLTLTLPTNVSKTLTATIQPTDATNKNVTWSSSNTSVATVDQTGKVTAISVGLCTITATAADDSDVKAECTVTVVQLVTSITLNQTSLTLNVDDTTVLTATVQPDNATDKSLEWSSSNTSVATVDQTGKVTAVALGSCTITATAIDGSGVKGICAVTVDYEWVDLGLPSGTLWATCNVGASSPENYGDHFAWGETTTKSNYSWSTYKYCKGSEKSLTKYCTQSEYGYNGFTDGKTELEPEDDAATINWGNNWQMPSIEQFEELINSSYTTTELTTSNGVNGCKITSKRNRKSIFLPGAGYFVDTYHAYAGNNGVYRSRSLFTNLPSHACHFVFQSNGLIDTYGNGHDRRCGQSVRPVRKQ